MADFNVNLSSPQGAGAGAIAPVQERAAAPRDYNALGNVADIFAKTMKSMREDDAKARKEAVIAEYVNNEKVYTDALVGGSWNAAQVGMASRANYTKLMASYPEYRNDLVEAKKAYYEGSDTGEAQKQVDRDIAFREGQKKEASTNGYSFYPGMSKEAEDKTLDAHNFEVTEKKKIDAQYKANAETRAANGEDRANDNHLRTVTEWQRKEDAMKSLVTIADKNFDIFSTVAMDLSKDTTKTFEEKTLLINSQADRIKRGLLLAAASNPEMAAPYQKLVEDITNVSMKLIDPKAKAEGEAATLKAEFDKIIYTAKLAAVQDPRLRTAVVGSQLFNDPTLINLVSSPAIIGWLSNAGVYGEGQGPKPAPVVGTPDEEGALKALKGALNNLNSGKVQDKEKATKEAVNAANEVMRQTTAVDGSVSPSALKNLSAFYASTEFGILAASGKVDKATMQNAKEVFQVSYIPAVQTAVMQRLDAPGVKASVTVKMSGSNVVFERKPSKDGRSFGEMLGDSLDIGRSLQGHDVRTANSDLKKAEAGLNTLIHMGAHMEGTTDYGKYWEANKHLLLPGMFADPEKVETKPKGASTSTKPTAPSDAEWDAITKAYKKGQAERNQVQLMTLKEELSNETDPTNKARLNREIQRVEETIKKDS